MGPCQGKLCHLNSIRVYAKETRTEEEEIGTTTARPPWTPVSMGAARRPPTRSGQAHVDAPPPQGHGREGLLDGRVAAAALLRDGHAGRGAKVHESIGIIDVSTLGKILVKGPDAGAFLDRLYPNRFSDLEDRSHPLRDPHERRRPDLRRRHDRPPLRGRVLRDDHVDRRRRRLPVVRVVERRLAHGRRAART